MSPLTPAKYARIIQCDPLTLQEVTGLLLNKLNDQFWISKQMRGF